MFVTVYCMCILMAGVSGSSRFFKDQYHNLHYRMEDKDFHKTFGVDSREKVPEYEVISPYQSDESGNMVNPFIHGHIRTRRSANEPNFSYFKVQAFGRSLHLNLTEARPLISSAAIVQTVDNNGGSTYKEIPRGAYYTGHVISDPGSLVAVSGKEGLAGMIRTSDDTFYIQPLPSNVVRNNGFKHGHPHVIYRRSIEVEVSSDYHVSDKGARSRNWEKANRHRRRRRKRQTPHKFLEMALVADNFMISAYGEEELTTRILTISHIVTQLYHDNSIGAIKISPVIVRLVLKKDGFGYDASSLLGQRIKALAEWANDNLPPSDGNPGHPDAVVLFTRGKNGGIASLDSTCAANFGIAVTSDAGLGSAVIMAHELAHTMGVPHDGDDGVPCANHKNIMASTIASGPGSFKWSACSREKFQEFLSHRSHCLDDFPPISAVIHEPKSLYGKLPGQVISRDQQCKMIYSQKYYACPQRLKFCGSLGCTDNGYKCVFSATPPADGTRCGDRHWCINGECMDDGSRVIHGRWSNWSTFSPCTRPCGGGVQSKSRTCNNPAPKNGGNKCIGQEKGHWRICNPQPCPAGTKSFRQLQCEEIDPHFVAYYHASAQCDLICRKGNTAKPQGKKVKDGTRCTNDPTNRDVCIQGACKLTKCDNMEVQTSRRLLNQNYLRFEECKTGVAPIGCDDGIESGMKRDRCGVCEGDSSKCKLVKKFWNEKCRGFGSDSACTIFEVPIGATSVYVEQDTPDKNLLGIKDHEGKYIIPIPSWSRTVYAAGTKVQYYHQTDLDINTVYIPGPTTEKLTIMFVPVRLPKAGVWYEMYDPTLSSFVGVQHVRWNVTAWGQCSRKCATGKQRRTVECARVDDRSYIGDGLCLQKSSKPAAERSCNTHPCQPVWYQSGWSPCSRTCGKGLQRRQIHCRRKITPFKYQILSDSSCRGNKPTGPTQRSCNAIICHAEWKPTAWSKCSSTCTGGVKKRRLVCKRRNDLGRTVLAPEIHCHHAPMPQTTMDCNSEVPCPTPAAAHQYRGLGCFKDKEAHAIPELVKNYRSNIDWTNMRKTINDCAGYVHKNYPKNKVFALQFYGECWTGSEAQYTYDVYGRSSECWENVGQKNSNYVYTFD